MSWQVLQLGHPQVRNGDEIGRRAEASGGPLGLLQQAVHRLDEGVRSVVGHSTNDRIGALADGRGQLLEGIEPLEFDTYDT